MNLLDDIQAIKDHPKVYSISKLGNTPNYRIIGSEFEKHIHADFLIELKEQLNKEI